jgi:hypothetical protein
MEYDWPKIFEQKSDTELSEILKGKTLHTLDARTEAGKVLIARKGYTREIRNIVNYTADTLEIRIKEIDEDEMQKIKKRTRMIVILNASIFTILLYINFAILNPDSIINFLKFSKILTHRITPGTLSSILIYLLPVLYFVLFIFLHRNRYKKDIEEAREEQKARKKLLNMFKTSFAKYEPK